MPSPTRTDLPWDLWDEFMSQAQERYAERMKAKLQIHLANPFPKLDMRPDFKEDVVPFAWPYSINLF